VTDDARDLDWAIEPPAGFAEGSMRLGRPIDDFPGVSWRELLPGFTIKMESGPWPWSWVYVSWIDEIEPHADRQGANIKVRPKTKHRLGFRRAWHRWRMTRSANPTKDS
jgi:hypothetical protein